MAILNKNIRSCVTEGTHTWKSQLPTFLHMYRGTPHTSTKMSPFEALTGRKMKLGLPSIPSQAPTPNNTHDKINKKICENDYISKQKMCEYADRKRKTWQHFPSKATIKKLTPPFSPLPYIITQKKGSMITAQRSQNSITLNSSHFKPRKGL